MRLRLKVFRFDPSFEAQPRYQTYEVEAAPSDRLLDCLNRIKWELDGGLSYRMSCAHGVCGSCAVRIDGRCALVCQTLVKDFASLDREIPIEPLPNFKVLKDLIVDLDPFFARVEAVRPYLLAPESPPDKERFQSQADRKKIDEVIRCILCACCTAACPVTPKNSGFPGPAALVQAFRRIFDSRDREKPDRLAQLDQAHGVWACENRFECTRVCPKSIPVTKSINFIKREIEQSKGGPGK